jgi:hypothetical protein
MENAQGIRLNFIPLDPQSISGRLWRKELPEGQAKPDDSLCYSLPRDAGADERAQYLISFESIEGWTTWQFHPDQNRQLALRYLLEVLLINARRGILAGRYAFRGKFGHYIAYALKETQYGTQEIRVDSYFLPVKNQFGFLVDFHFLSKDPNDHNRETQRLSLSLDERYRSNKNAYIDRERVVKDFVANVFSGLFPLTHPTLAEPVRIAQSFVFLTTEALDSKVFVLGENNANSSQWKGLERYGPLRGIPGEVGCIMLYRRDDRPLAEDLYRALMGKLNGVAFGGIPQVFRTEIATFHGVIVGQWTRREVDDALAKIGVIKSAASSTRFIVIMVEDRENSAIYYQAKFGMLSIGLPLQVVSSQLIRRRDQFKWSVSNIALQVFTKLGGLPWKVRPAHDKCLIIGLGQAHRMSGRDIIRYFAYCVATDSSGLYKKIAVLGDSTARGEYITELKTSLVRELAEASVEKYTDCTIHVPFRLKQYEMRALEEALNEAQQTGRQMTLSVLKVNDQHRFFGYANNNSRVPIEGSVAYISDHAALLWFEGLKKPNDIIGKRVSGPMHVEFLWPRDSLDLEMRKEHLQDLFNLSGTNWRGFNARSTPISVYYCRLIAKFLAEFPDEAARISGTEHPWFL